MRLCFVNAFVFLKCSFFKGRFHLKNSSVTPTSFELALNNGHGSLLLLHFYKQEGGQGGGRLFSKVEGIAWRKVSTEPFKMPVGCWSQDLSWGDGGLVHSQLLGQVVEACDVVHTALTHHASKLRVHLRAQPESVQCTTVRTPA